MKVVVASRNPVKLGAVRHGFKTRFPDTAYWIGLLTDGLYTRESIYTQTVVMSLVPFVNPLFKERPAP